MKNDYEINISIKDLIGILDGYGTPSQPLTIGLLKHILTDLAITQTRKKTLELMGVGIVLPRNIKNDK